MVVYNYLLDYYNGINDNQNIAIKQVEVSFTPSFMAIYDSTNSIRLNITLVKK
mgnify:CR=1 FL=1